MIQIHSGETSRPRSRLRRSLGRFATLFATSFARTVASRPCSLLYEALLSLAIIYTRSTWSKSRSYYNKRFPVCPRAQHFPSGPKLKKISVNKWHITEKQPLLRDIIREPHIIDIISYKTWRNPPESCLRSTAWTVLSVL